jgi:hypothetical protein
MPSCWTCGEPVHGISFRCGNCRVIESIKHLEESAQEDVVLTKQEDRDWYFIALEDMAEKVSESIENIAHVVEWVFLNYNGNLLNKRMF